MGIFVYVGAEVAIGSFLVSYFMQPGIAGLGAQQAAKYVSFYWGGAMVGRFAGSAILRVVRTGTLLGLNALVACALVLTSVVNRRPRGYVEHHPGRAVQLHHVS